MWKNRKRECPHPESNRGPHPYEGRAIANYAIRATLLEGKIQSIYTNKLQNPKVLSSGLWLLPTSVCSTANKLQNTIIPRVNAFLQMQAEHSI